MKLISLSISPVKGEYSNGIYLDCLDLVKRISNKFIVSEEHGKNDFPTHCQMMFYTQSSYKSIHQVFTRRFSQCDWWNGFGKPKSGKCACMVDRTSEPLSMYYPLKEAPEVYTVEGITENELVDLKVGFDKLPNFKEKCVDLMGMCEIIANDIFRNNWYQIRNMEFVLLNGFIDDCVEKRNIVRWNLLKKNKEFIMRCVHSLWLARKQETIVEYNKQFCYKHLVSSSTSSVSTENISILGDRDVFTEELTCSESGEAEDFSEDMTEENP